MSTIAGLAGMAFALIVPALGQQAGTVENSYRRPPAELAAIVDAPPLPAVSISPTRETMLLMQRRGLPSIAELAAPELRIAGLRINPKIEELQ